MSSYNKLFTGVDNPDQTPVKTGYKAPFIDPFGYEDFLEEADKWENILGKSLGTEVDRNGGVLVEFHHGSESMYVDTEERLNSVLDKGQPVKGEVVYTWENGHSLLEFEDPGLIGNYEITFEVEHDENNIDMADFFYLAEKHGYEPL